LAAGSRLGLVGERVITDVVITDVVILDVSLFQSHPSLAGSRLELVAVGVDKDLFSSVRVVPTAGADDYITDQ
jgi:hypothetical protein